MGLTPDALEGGYIGVTGGKGLGLGFRRAILTLV